MEAGTDVIVLTGDHAAALATRHPTYSVDSFLRLAFKEYTKRHYKSWVAFARDNLYGEDLRLILVSGFDMTKDFAMVAYSNNPGFVQSGATSDIPMFGVPSLLRWRTPCLPYTKHGPNQLTHLTEEHHPTELQYCVFIRGHTRHSSLRPLPKMFWARVRRHGAGRDSGGLLDLATSDIRSKQVVIGSGPLPVGPLRVLLFPC